MFGPMLVARFESEALRAAHDGEQELRTGKIFQAGDYPERQFRLTEREMAELVNSFEPVPLMVEHGPTPFDGRLGVLESVFQHGPELFGRFRIPAWLSAVFGGQPMKVSLAFGPRKEIIEASLVRSPAIPDAAFSAAFAQVTGDVSGVMEQNPTITPEEKGALAKLAAFFTATREPAPAPTSLRSEIMDAVQEAIRPLSDRIEQIEVRLNEMDEAKEPESPSSEEDAALERSAADFADGNIRAGRLMPAEREGVIAAFCATARSGGANHVLFANGRLQPCAALDAYTAAINGRSQSELMRPAIQTLFSQELSREGFLPLSEAVFGRSGEGSR